MQNECVIAIDAGATYTRMALVGCAGIVHHCQKEETLQRDFRPLIGQALSAAGGAGRRVRAIILGVPGPVAYARREVVKLPNLPHWDVAALSKALRVLVRPPAFLANDADLAALGEHQLGAGRNIENLVFASCGSGIGAGVILGGRLAVGRFSLGEIGHAIIDLESRQTVEQVSSGMAWEQWPSKAMAAPASGGVVRPSAREADPIARVAAAFAICVRTLALCFMPDRIIVGGGHADAHPELLGAARDEIARIQDMQPLKPGDVVKAELGDDAGLVGGYPFWRYWLDAEASSCGEVA